ncbi:MAG TPA: glycosyltransferase family protein [Chthonomonadaceae bacterium]|nr:glycosyltransferase family protein [Chthonomonadaceae bacterium]
MRFLFFIKGDGRGHITQALALEPMLTQRGHTVGPFVVGCAPETRLPAFLHQKAAQPIERIYSPNFVPDRRHRGISWGGTILHGVRNVLSYRHSFSTIRRMIETHRPDVIVSMYEPALALYALRRALKIPIIHIAHQYLMLHNVFLFPPGRAFERHTILNYTRLTGVRSAKMLALSFYEVEDDEQQRIYPVPPLLRSEVFERESASGDHFLVYVLNHGLAEGVRAFNAHSPEILVHAFWNNADAPQTLEVSPTLTFHQLDDQLFLDKMASCRGVACTAGFETVSEAFYYQKPALLMPSPGQYEQFANAFDAERIGAGRMVSTLDLALLNEYLPNYRPKHDAYLAWMRQATPKILYHLENPTADGSGYRPP